jgi:hypothetical protein
MSEPWNKYDLTATMVNGRLGSEFRSGSVTIDCHAHIFSEATADYVVTHMDVARAATMKGTLLKIIALQQNKVPSVPLMRPWGMDPRLQENGGDGPCHTAGHTGTYQC